jgi:class 3 adenylate cyclase
MSNKIAVTCFTDIKGSVELNEDLGNRRFTEEISEHIRVAKELAERLGGTYVKNIGDANMVTFDGLEASVSFAVQLQEYCRVRPGLSRQPIALKVSMFLGVVEPKNGDVFGSGVNQASRLEKKAAQSQIVVNKDLVDALKKVIIYLTDQAFGVIFTAWKRQRLYRPRLYTFRTLRTATTSWLQCAGPMVRFNARAVALRT